MQRQCRLANPAISLDQAISEASVTTPLASCYVTGEGGTGENCRKFLEIDIRKRRESRVSEDTAAAESRKKDATCHRSAGSPDTISAVISQFSSGFKHCCHQYMVRLSKNSLESFENVFWENTKVALHRSADCSEAS